MQYQTLIPCHGQPVQAVIQSGRGVSVLLVPSMEASQERNVALIEFMRAAHEKTGRGFASFLPAQPEHYDDTAHSGATQALLKLAAESFGLTGQWIVAGAHREHVVVERAHWFAKGRQDVTVAPVYFDQKIYNTLPERVAFVRTLTQLTNQLM